jgi:uroporphyrinogen-III synthase
LTDSLRGARVALLEARMESELASLVRRHGGEPVCVPALREVECECEAATAKAVDAAGREGAVVVLATGVGLSRWLKVADGLGRGGELRGSLGRAVVVCRGPKPVAVLKREGLVAHVRAPAPHTSRELLSVLEGVEVSKRDVVFVHDGGGSAAVPDALAARGAVVSQVQPYRWALPEDASGLRALVGEALAGQIAAMAFTTQVQATHLFAVADGMGSRDALKNALRSRITVAAIGPTTAGTLTGLGAPPHVVPAQASMGAMVVALGEYLSGRTS